MNGYELERKTLDALTEALMSLPQARTKIGKVEHPLPGNDQPIDARLDLWIGGREVVLLVEVKKTVYPRDVRQLLWQLSAARNMDAHKKKSSVVPLVAAESISAGARSLLQDEQIGFFDMGGSLFLPAEAAYLYIERPVPKTLEKSVRTLFTAKRAQVLHALLINHGKWLGVNDLAGIAEVSPATASETLVALERMEWISTRGQGPSKERCLSNASALLDEWKTHIQTSKKPLSRRRYYVPGGDLKDITHHIANYCDYVGVKYAFTQDAAAQRYAPFLSSYGRLALRVAPAGIQDMLANIGARSVTEGANLDIIETKSAGEFLFREERDGVWLASPVQVYLDLLRGEGRSRDMANHLRTELLRI